MRWLRWKVHPLVPGVACLLIATSVFAQAPASEQITVERLIVDAYVTDYSGNPILGLSPADFKVEIDGTPATIEAVDWISATDDGSSTDFSRSAAGEQLPAPPGRLIVIFFQTDFQRQRLAGQIRILNHANRFIRGLTSRDRVAVLSFDSHLKLRADFIRDPELLKKVATQSLLTDLPRPIPSDSTTSIGALMVPEAMRRAATPERALFLIGSALESIPGPKTLVMFGWGLGRFGSSGVRMIRDYSSARMVLERSRTTVFALDISDADYHSLEVGLRQAAADTGGFYEKTHLFPALVMDRLQRTLSGRYEIALKDLPARRGTHKVDVGLRSRRGTVLARTTYVN